MPASAKGKPFSDETLTDDVGELADASREFVAPHVFVALECDRTVAGVARHSLANVDRLVVGRGSARTSERVFRAPERTLSIRVPDSHMSAEHACLVREGGAFAVEDLQSRNGVRLNGIPITKRTALSDGDLVEAGHTVLAYRESVRTPVGEPADWDSGVDDGASLLLTADARLARRADALARVARSQTPVLILGETGTGKEVLARAIHRASGRTGPFVAVNCCALPATLLEAQLFGHVRGAFSGAVGDAVGWLRSSDGGTLLLDEIGDLPAPAQVALLRALEQHEVVPVGGVRPVKVDLRVLGATHRPLHALVASGQFRQDLFARLAGFTFTLPPLRERREDIGVLVAAIAAESAIRFKASVGRALLRYDWPLNVRELRQSLQAAAALAGEGPIDLVHLPPAVAAASRATRPDRGSRAAAMGAPLRERLEASLARHEGNVSEVARDLGKARMQIQRWLKRFGIDPRSFANREREV